MQYEDLQLDGEEKVQGGSPSLHDVQASVNIAYTRTSANIRLCLHVPSTLRDCVVSTQAFSQFSCSCS